MIIHLGPYQMWLARRLLRHFSGKKRNSIGRLISLNDEIKDKATNKNKVIYPIVAACTAESYDFAKLLPFLQKNFNLSPFICDEVLHVQMPTKRGEVFFFKNGSLVFWSNDAETGEENVLTGLKETLLPIIKSFEVSPFKEADFEELNYKYVNSR
jgi:uncharacterized Rmd1/YagE family protein